MKMNFWEKSENAKFLHSLRLSFMQKIRKNLLRGFPGKWGKTDRETDRETETDPNIRVLRTLSLSRRTKNPFEGLPCMDMISTFLKKISMYT